MFPHFYITNLHLYYVYGHAVWPKEIFTQTSWGIWFSEDSWWSAVESSKIHLRFWSCPQKPWFLFIAQVAFDMWAWVEKASFAVNDRVYADLNRRHLDLLSNAL